MTEENRNPHYVTPRDAEISYCPMSMGGHEGKDLCVGPQCMAWRWTYKLSEDDEGQLEAKYSTTHGYCGMVRG